MDLNSIPNVRAWTEGVPVEPEAVQQIANIAALPIVGGPVAVMPDVHVGKGATVGTVLATRAAVIPAAVGVDIGCGMCAVRTTLRADDLPDSLAGVRAAIEAAVPVGFAMHDEPPRTSRHGLEGIALARRMKGLDERFDKLSMARRLGRFDARRLWRQAGTLGGGNHFCELCVDERDDVWVMLHSGSRNVGKTIGEAAISMARERALRDDLRLPDRDLAWLDEGSADFDAYIAAMHWAQDYAALNRDLMLHATMRAIGEAFGRDVGSTEQAVNCHHNFTQLEAHLGERLWITRKGAVSARAGQLGIIPGSMGTRSYIVRGKGEAASYCSCSHGAGRRMSRGAARRAFSAADLSRQTAGVECRKDEGVVDEIPAAYKDIDAVMAAQADLVEPVATLKQVLCVKG